MKAEVKNPSGALTDCLVTDNADGTYSVDYTPFENGDTKIHSQIVLLLMATRRFSCCFFVCVSGLHTIQVLYDDTPVPKSPFRVSVTEGCKPSRVVATGPGLEKALTDKPNNFKIITRCCCRGAEGQRLFTCERKLGVFEIITKPGNTSNIA